MKKPLRLLLIFIVLSVLSACTTDTPQETEPPHTHNYVSSVTQAPTCTEPGITTYTCTCGDSYTEDIALAAHNWGQWIQAHAPSGTTQSEKTRSCQACPAKETVTYEMHLDELFSTYVSFIRSNGDIFYLDYFTSFEDVDIENFILWVSPYVTHKSYQEGNLGCATYKVSDLNAFTEKHFGCTLAYSNATTYYGTFVYDENSNSITYIRDFSFGGAPDILKYNGYVQQDDTHYIISYSTHDLFDNSLLHSGTIELENKDGQFIVLSHKSA